MIKTRCNSALWCVLTIIVFAITNNDAAHAQALSTRAPKTLEILDTLVRNATRSLVKQLRSPRFPQDTMLLRLKPHEGVWLLEQHIFSNGLLLKRPQLLMTSSITDSLHRTSTTAQVLLPPSPTAANTSSILVIRFSDLSVRYFSGDDFATVVREAQCVLTGQVEHSNGVVQVFEPCAAQYQDTVSRTLVPTLDSRQYSFASASLPEAAPNFWRQVVEPAVFVIAGALVVIILFFVRTQ